MGNGGQARCKSCKSGMAWCATLASVQQQGRYDDPVPLRPMAGLCFVRVRVHSGYKAKVRFGRDTKTLQPQNLDVLFDLFATCMDACLCVCL